MYNLYCLTTALRLSVFHENYRNLAISDEHVISAKTGKLTKAIYVYCVIICVMLIFMSCVHKLFELSRIS